MINKIKSLTNSDNKKRLIGNFFSLIVLRGFQFLIPLVTLPYLVRTVGIEKFGLINFALSLSLYFGAMIQFGFSMTATREIARNRDNLPKLAQIYSATLTASLVLAIISATLLTLIVLSFDRFKLHLNLYLFTLGFIVFQSLLPIWIFQGMEKMKYITFLSLGASIIYLISLFAFVRHEGDFMIVPLLNGVAAFVTFIIAIILIHNQLKIKFTLPKIHEVRTILQKGRHAFVSQFAPNFYNNSALFLLGMFTNNATLGLYAAANKVIDAIASLGYILSNTFFPYLSRNPEKHRTFSKIMLTTGFVLTISTFVAAEWITIQLFNANSLEIAIYIRYLSICIFLLFAALTYGTNYLMLVGKDKTVQNITLYISIIFFGFALITIPAWGIWGAIATVTGARFFLSFLQFIFYKNNYSGGLRTLAN